MNTTHTEERVEIQRGEGYWDDALVQALTMGWKHFIVEDATPVSGPGKCPALIVETPHGPRSYWIMKTEKRGYVSLLSRRN